jgi:hypothetical protein
MVIDMNDEQLRTLADVQGFLDGTVAMDFTVAEDEPSATHSSRGPSSALAMAG